MDRGDWQAAVYGVAKSRTRLSDFTSLQALFQILQISRYIKQARIAVPMKHTFQGGKGRNDFQNKFQIINVTNEIRWNKVSKMVVK